MEKPKILEYNDRCYGCGVCKYVCPVNAISMEINEEGFLYPTVDNNLCIKCEKCVNICPKFNKKEINACKQKEKYGVKHINEKVRLKSRSGGAFVALSDAILKKNGSIYGAVFIDPKKVEHIRAVTKEERDRMCGSKYVQSDITSIIDIIGQDLKNDKFVFFTGTPCQCASIYNLYGKFEKLVLCDFVCHGVPSQMLWSDYINWCEKKYKRKVINADFRDKQKYKWSKHIEKIDVDNKTIYSKRYTNLFYANQCLRKSCYNCGFIEKRYSDITLGDFWGINEINLEFNDEKGVSLVIINTDKGKDLFEDIKEQIKYFDVGENELVHYNLKRPTKCPVDRDRFWKDYIRNGFEYVSKKYGSYDLIHRIKNKIVDKID